MARPKQNKAPEEVVREAFEKEAFDARKARIAQAEKIKAETRADDIDYYPEFKSWWAAKKREYKRPAELLDVLWIHLKATQKTSPQDWEEGLAHFGLKR